MNETNQPLSKEERLKNAIQSRCWRTACARIREIAKEREEKYGIPYEKTLEDYDYMYYRKAIKTFFK